MRWKLVSELPRGAEIVALLKRISDECMIARPDAAILQLLPRQKVERLIAEECEKRKVSPDRIAEREPPRGEIPAVRAEVSRKLVEDCGITIEIAAGWRINICQTQRASHAVIPSSQQCPDFIRPSAGLRSRKTIAAVATATTVIANGRTGA
jgi:hypothetical protein